MLYERIRTAGMILAGLLLIGWGTGLIGCGTLRVDVREDQAERLEVRCSAPSRIAWSVDGEVLFERTSRKALPGNVRCVPGAIEVAP